MNQTNLDAEGNFLVKESKSTNYIVGALLLAVFFISLSFGDYGWSNFLFGICIFLVPGTVAIARARRNSVIMKINATGFYYYGKLIAPRNLFKDAEVQDKTPVASYKDNFQLYFRYYSADCSLIYTRIIPLTDTQDKADEEIMEAIWFYYDASKLNTREHN
jgi:hypothetical protein